MLEFDPYEILIVSWGCCVRRASLDNNSSCALRARVGFPIALSITTSLVWRRTLKASLLCSHILLHSLLLLDFTFQIKLDRWYLIFFEMIL